LLEFLFSKPLRKTDVREYLRSSPAVRHEVRKKALALIDRYREEQGWERYHAAARHVVRQPYLNVSQYQFAWQQAQAAYQLAPEPSACLTTLGLAQYRLGQYEAAVETLARSEKLRATRADSHPADLAFLAMAQYQLGRKEQAQATLARLREALRNPQWAKDGEIAALLGEAEALMVRKVPEKK
jgi:tetratricopeptide (TPR) repeat protein